MVQQAHQHLREFELRAHSSYTKKVSRMVKIISLMAAPYEYSLYLDSESYACKSLPELFRHAGGFGFLDTTDLAIAINHIGSWSFSRGALWDRYGVPSGWTELNSGVIFVSPRREGVHEVLCEWLVVYLSSEYAHVADTDRGRGDGVW